MERFDIQADQRLIARLVRGGTQGNAIRALLELIANSDDSYRRLEDEGIDHDGVIELLYAKEGSCGLFSVRDGAEGMSHDDLSGAFRKYGAATSGLKDGKSVAGFFGTGAKNALAGMSDGRICTFNDDTFSDLRIFLRGDCLKGELDGPKVATQKIRAEHGIRSNGTVAYFRADPDKGQKVPRFDTVHEDLANHWRLRKIMTNPARTILLVDEAQKKKKRRLRYSTPKGQERMNEQFTVPCERYGEFPIHLSIWRAESELRQEGDDRPGGLLIIDDRGATLDMSLFRYDREPLAARLFGEVTFGRFRDLLAKEEAALDEKREGLNRTHPVCKAVVAEIEKRIEALVQEESRRQKEARSKIDDDERTRYRDAFKILNEIAEAEAEEVHNLGQDATTKVEPPPNGFCLYPDCAHLSVGKRYNFEVRIDTNRFAPGTLVRMSSSSPKLSVIGNTEFKVVKAEKGGVARRFVTVQGTEAGIRATLRATIGKNIAEATVYVEPEKAENDFLYKWGLVFRPESLTVRMNKARRAVLRVCVKLVEGGTKINIRSEHHTVHVWPEQIVVNEANARGHVAEYEVEVWGDEPDVTAIVTAEGGERYALLEVNTRTEEEQERPKGQGMFSGEPVFEQGDSDPLQRISYSRETGKIIIYVNFPSVRFYLGEDLRHKKSLAAQVLLADLIAERCFFEMARAKKRDVAISPEALPERIQHDAREFSKRYGLRVHKALVDATLVQKDQATLKVQSA
jgi:hypothetical protein